LHWSWVNFSLFTAIIQFVRGIYAENYIRAEQSCPAFNCEISELLARVVSPKR